MELDGKSQYHNIKQYIKVNDYPLKTFNNDNKIIHHLLMGFFLSKEVLYKKNFYDGMLLKCVDVVETETIMVEIHEGICVTHANSHMMAQQIMRVGYY